MRDYLVGEYGRKSLAIDKVTIPEFFQPPCSLLRDLDT
jgi:hypothetical protein